MATNDPYQREPANTTRTDYTVVEHRSNGGLWALVIILILLAVAAVLYFTGVFNGRSLYTEKNKVDIHVSAPASGGTGGATSGQGQ